MEVHHKEHRSRRYWFRKHLRNRSKNTNFAGTRRVFLRGTTTEVIDQIADRELDFVYIDGDHTLRGITIDLIRVYPKIRIGGDDFCENVWYHSSQFEPSLVFPFAVYFCRSSGSGYLRLA